MVYYSVEKNILEGNGMMILGLTGGMFGLFFAIPTIFFIGSLTTQIEGGIISEAALNIADWIMIIILPLFAMIISMITAYYTGKQTLQKML